MNVSVFRDCDTLRLRKVVIEVSNDGDVVDSSRMFAGLFFKRRLKRKIRRAVRRAKIMLDASMDPLP